MLPILLMLDRLHQGFDNGFKRPVNRGNNLRRAAYRFLLLLNGLPLLHFYASILPNGYFVDSLSSMPSK